jgi:hypothetical protein
MTNTVKMTNNAKSMTVSTLYSVAELNESNHHA